MKGGLINIHTDCQHQKAKGFGTCLDIPFKTLKLILLIFFSVNSVKIKPNSEMDNSVADLRSLHVKK